MIQLQYIQDGVNRGGLYLVLGEIASIRCLNTPGRTSRTFVLLSCGVEYEIANPLMDVLDALNLYLHGKSNQL